MAPKYTKPIQHNNLPARRKFVGRAQDLVTIRSRIESNSESVIVIFGFGGRGKTALALEVAHIMLNEADSETVKNTVKFQYFIWISAKDRTIDLNDILDGIARGMEIDHITKVPFEKKENAILKAFRRKMTLIIIDDFDSDDDESTIQFLKRLPQNAKVLLTSRKRLVGDDIGFYKLGMMSEDDVRLFLKSEADRLEMDRLKNIPEDHLRKIKENTGGNPLAIKWILGQMLERGFSLSFVMDKLRKAKGQLYQKIFRNSWHILDDESKEILRILPLFSESSDILAIEHVSNINSECLNMAMGQLVKLGLVDVNDALSKKRYSLHALTSNYVKRIVSEEKRGLESQIEKMVDYYLDFVSRKNERWEDSSAIDDMEAEISNIFKAMSWCLENHQYNKFVRFHRATYNLLWTRGYWHENLRNGELAVEAADQIGDKESEAWIRLESLGWIYFSQGKYYEAEEHYRIADDYFRQHDDIAGIIRSCNYLGRLAYKRDNYVDAKEILEEGLAISRKNITDIMGTTFLESALGEIESAMGNYQSAYDHYESVKNIRRGLKDDARICSVICDLGDLDIKMKNWEKARSNFLEGLETAKKVKRMDVQGRCFRGLAEIHKAKEELDIAFNYAKLAVETFSTLMADQERQTSLLILRKIEAAKRRKNVFICYSHRDRKWLELFKRHLKPFEKDGLAVIWDDNAIKPGQKWELEINRALKAAKIAILFISADFLSSDFIVQVELPSLLKAEKDDGLVILPVHIGPSAFTYNENLVSFQPVNNPEKTVKDMGDAERERFWVSLYGHIKKNLNI